MKKKKLRKLLHRTGVALQDATAALMGERKALELSRQETERERVEWINLNRERTELKHKFDDQARRLDSTMRTCAGAQAERDDLRANFAKLTEENTVLQATLDEAIRKLNGAS